MNPQDPLAALAPLREPAAIGWWPLAPGWWFLIALAMLLLTVLGWLAWRRWRARAYRRLASARLTAIDLSDPDYFAKVNRILKAVAVRSYGRRRVARLSGRQWLEFLQASSGGRVSFPEQLADAPYRKPEDLLAQGDALSRAAQAWLGAHGEPS